MRYLLDTNTVSYAFRGEGRVAQRLLAVAPGEIGLPAPVLFECRAGILKLPTGARRDAMLGALSRLVSAVTVAPLDQDAAEAAARVRSALHARGRPIGPLDTLIAGIAVSLGSTLVTRNLREFGQVEGLRLEDWY